MTEGLLNHYGKDFFNAYSAGSHPAGYVHPLSIKTLEKNKIFLHNFKSQSWDDFSDINFDLLLLFVITQLEKLAPCISKIH